MHLVLGIHFHLAGKMGREGKWEFCLQQGQREQRVRVGQRGGSHESGERSLTACGSCPVWGLGGERVFRLGSSSLCREIIPLCRESCYKY